VVLVAAQQGVLGELVLLGVELGELVLV